MAKTLNEFFGSKPVSSITVFDIERYKTKRKDQGIALSTINKEIKGVLSKMLSLAREAKWITSNPV